MSAFQESRWAESAFAQEYRENADHYIPDRPALFQVMGSFFRRFVLRDGQAARVCDLGCGDGILTARLLELGHPLRATLIDGSPDMLAAARGRLVEHEGLTFIQSGFEELIRNEPPLGEFDFIVSGFAIHHTERPLRRALFRFAHDHLAPGGSLLNMDVGLAPTAALTEWQYELWRQWILAHGARAGLGDRYRTIPDQARANPDNRYSPLADQLEDLRDAGFTNVDCHYRNGLITLYTGTRPGVAGH